MNLNLIDYKEMLNNKLLEFFKNKEVLEVGFFSGNYTKILAKHVKKLTSIDISSFAYNLALKNLKNENFNNVDLKIMDAAKMDFKNESFDTVFTSSFHEINLTKQKKVLHEINRVLKKSGFIMFFEPKEESVTNELFKVFDPNENHAKRISTSKENIKHFADESGYVIKEFEDSISKAKFNTEDELLDEMLSWWQDIKIPKDEKEKSEMKAKIKSILLNNSKRDFENLEVNETSWTWVLNKKKGQI